MPYFQFRLKDPLLSLPFPCSQNLALRAQVADAFLSKFQLKPDEIKVLRGTRDGLHPVSKELLFPI